MGKCINSASAKISKNAQKLQENLKKNIDKSLLELYYAKVTICNL